jgi:hypothetical protein
MVIGIDPALPCGQVMDGQTRRLCGKPARQAVATPLEDGTWELLPVCSFHLRDATTPEDGSLPWLPSGRTPQATPSRP